MYRNFLVVIATTLLVNSVQACVCLPQTLSEAVKNADVIFRGVVSDARVIPGKRKGTKRVITKISIIKIFKGIALSKTVEVFESEGYSDCAGLISSIGADLLLFARREKLTAPSPNLKRIPEWGDVVPVGAEMIFPIPCSFSGETRGAQGIVQELEKITGAASARR